MRDRVRDRLVKAIQARTRQAIETGDLSAVLAPDAMADAAALLERVLENADPDVDAARAVGDLCWQRALARPADDVPDDLRLAAQAFGLVYESDPDAVPEELRGFFDARLDLSADPSRGRELFDRYQHDGDPIALTGAIRAFRAALDDCPDDHPERCDRLADLFAALCAMAEEIEDADTFLDAVDVGYALIEATDRDDPEFAGYANDLGLLLRSVFERTGDVNALREWVHLASAASAVTAADAAVRAGRLSNHGVALEMLYEHTGDRAAMDEAVVAARAAVALMPADDPNRATCLANLGTKLRVSFDLTGDPATLREAVTVGRGAVDITPAGDPRLMGNLSDLAAALEQLYEHTEDVAALVEAVGMGTAAVALAPKGDPRRLPALTNLGISLRMLFERTEDADMLDEAVAAHREVVAATPDGHPQRAGRLTNLGNTLRCLHGCADDPDILSEAVDTCQAAIAALPDGHPMLAANLSNLAAALADRFRHSNDLDALREAVAANRTALKILPPDHSAHCRFQSNLGKILCMLFEAAGDVQDLRDAIEASRAAVIEAADDHSELASYLSGLVDVVHTAIERSDDQHASSQALAALEAAADALIDTRPDLLADIEAILRDTHAAIDRSPSSIRRLRLARVRDRVTRFTADNDPATVLTADAVTEAFALLCAVPDPLDDISVTQAAGLLFWARFAARGSLDGEPDLTAAHGLLGPVYQQIPDGVPPALRELFDEHPPEASDGPKVLGRIGHRRYREALDTHDALALDQAIDLCRLAVTAGGPDHPEVTRLLTDLGNALQSRFDWAEAPEDLAEAIDLARAAIATTGHDDPDRASLLSNLGNALLTRAEHLGGVADLDAAIEAGQAAVTGWPDHPDHSAMVNNLELALRTRSAYRDRLADLDKTIEGARAGVADGRPDHAGLGDALLARFENAGDPADLDEAVRFRRAAVAGDPDRAEYLSDLCSILRMRFVYGSGDDRDLADAIAAGRAAVAATPPGDGDLGARQSHLAAALSERHRRTGDRADLDEAVALATVAAALAPAGDPNRPGRLSDLCDVLRARFESFGAEADLDRAIDAGREAVAGGRGHDHVIAYLGNLGAALLRRFEYAGSQLDLDEAVDALSRASTAAPVDSPHRATMLANLCGALLIRFNSVRWPADLDAAIDAGREAVRITAPGHVSRSARLSALGAALQTRFAATADIDDIDEAVTLCETAVAEIPHGHSRRAPVLFNHARVLRHRHSHTGSAADLDGAVEAARAAVAAVPPDHPDRAGYLANLANILGVRSSCTGGGADLDEALAAGRAGAAIETAPSRIRAAAADQWGSLAAVAGQWQDAVNGFAAAANLVARTVSRHLTRSDQEFLLDGMGGVGSDGAACCVRAGLPGRAVELFEQGRGLLLGQALDSRTDLTQLTEQHPELAVRFTALCAELDRPGPAAATPAVVPGHDAAPTHEALVARRATAEALDRLLADIRELPGFDRFLRPLAVADLAPAVGHVVIVNVSRFGSHALILSADATPMAVPLPALTEDTVLRRVTDFLDAIDATHATKARTRAVGQRRVAETLEWLWDTVAGPVLDRLGITGPPQDGQPWPRLWWCPSGLMSFLPLHAAGHHDTASDEAPATVIDRVVCSTTPTLRALTHARRSDVPSTDSDRAVVVAMPHTPGDRADLPGAEAETALVRHHFPGPVHALTGQAATHEAVLAALPGARWAHFACHAHSDIADPSASQLLVADYQSRPLTVVDLARLRMADAQLAFLSACSTALPGAWLADEAIQLAAACQLAGYRHVIGTLWTIGDQHALDMAGLIYPAIAGTGDIASAVHSATLRMRDKWIDQPSVWASHIHVGP